MKEPTGAVTRALPYMRQLDGVRGLAIAAVLVQHFASRDNVLRFLPWGWFGVRLFFVLSGYLITQILLDGRLLADAEGSGHGRLLRRFYIRRLLRIFPVYYLTLLTAAVLNVPHVRDDFWWYAAYLSNWPATGIAIDGPAGHFWSLAVEEQFYFIWPWLILFLPRRVLLPAVLLLIGAAPVSRVLFSLIGYDLFEAQRVTPSCFDALGLGALLALAARLSPEGLQARTLDRTCTLAAIPLGLVLVAAPAGDSQQLVWLGLVDTALALLFAWFVGRAVIGFPGRMGKLLAWGPLVYMGKISYGLYVFHQFFAPRFFFSQSWLQPYLLAQPPEWQRMLVPLACVFALAVISWHCFEKPINDLKRYFPYA